MPRSPGALPAAVLLAWLFASTLPAPRLHAAAPGVPFPDNLGNAQYPRIDEQRRVTFHLRAPNARSVRLEGGAGLVPAPLDLARADDGTWSVTTAPAAPGFHYYWFTVDGLRLNDPARPTWFGWGRDTSGLEVPEEGSDFDEPDPRPASPRGQVRVCRHFSTVTGQWRRIHVYTPPDYDRRPRARYPVLYLLHGAGENERGWVEQGRAGIILDNLIARKEAVPMIVVADSGYAAFPAGTARPAGNGENGTGTFAAATAAFEEVLLRETIPWVETHFRARTDRLHRAMAGLSMGSLQTLDIALRHPDRFAWIAAMSLPPRQGFDAASAYGGAFRDAAAFNRRTRLLWFGAGTEEKPFHAHAAAVHDALRQRGIPSVLFSSPGTDHEWLTWRRSLHDLAPRLFTDSRAGRALRDGR